MVPMRPDTDDTARAAADMNTPPAEGAVPAGAPARRRVPRFLRPLSFLPAVLVMAAIFWFSSQNAEASSMQSLDLTTFLITEYSELFRFHWDPAELLQRATDLEHLVRKAAHFTEYFILSGTLILPMYLVYGRRGKNLLRPLLIVCALYAVSDEFHQLFLEGRAPLVTDAVIDVLGALACYHIARAVLHASRRRRAGRSQR